MASPPVQKAAIIFPVLSHHRVKLNKNCGVVGKGKIRFKVCSAYNNKIYHGLGLAPFDPVLKLSRDNTALRSNIYISS